MAKQPPPTKPLIVIKGRMETGDQFFARCLAERGTARQIIDEALAASREALDAGLMFIGLEADRAFVIKERDDNPDGTKPLSPEAWTACARLMSIGQATRAELAKRAAAEAAERAAAEKEAARVETETAARDLAAARDEAERVAAIAESERARAEAERAVAIAESERAARAEAERVARAKARSAKGGRGRTAETEKGVAKLEAFWGAEGWLDKYKPYDKDNKIRIDKTMKALKVSRETVYRYLRVIFPEKKRGRRPRAPSSETPRKKVSHIVRHIKKAHCVKNREFYRRSVT